MKLNKFTKGILAVLSLTVLSGVHAATNTYNVTNGYVVNVPSDIGANTTYQLPTGNNDISATNFKITNYSTNNVTLSNPDGTSYKTNLTALELVGETSTGSFTVSDQFLAGGAMTVNCTGTTISDIALAHESSQNITIAIPTASTTDTNGIAFSGAGTGTLKITGSNDLATLKVENNVSDASALLTIGATGATNLAAESTINVSGTSTNTNTIYCGGTTTSNTITNSSGGNLDIKEVPRTSAYSITSTGTLTGAHLIDIASDDSAPVASLVLNATNPGGSLIVNENLVAGTNKTITTCTATSGSIYLPASTAITTKSAGANGAILVKVS